MTDWVVVVRASPETVSPKMEKRQVRGRNRGEAGIESGGLLPLPLSKREKEKTCASPSIQGRESFST